VTTPRQVTAPKEDGAVVAEPPLGRVGELLAVNATRLAHGPDVLGRPWDELRDAARRALLEEAEGYLGAGGEPVPGRRSGPVVMAGHQPEPFHPGVWVKNFAIAGLARAHGGVAVNLVVDNDTAKSTALRLPSLGTPQTPRPHPVTVPFDQWVDEVPYEENPVRDEGLFRTFPERAAAVTGGWGFEPLLGTFWEETLRQAGRTPLLGERFAAARRWLERQWGCHNFEVPVSRVCRTEPFAWFACHLLLNLPRFHELYNACVHDYRQKYDVHSRNHPVPDLAEQDGWLEVPFWAWHPGQRRRGRLMGRLGGGGVQLRVGDEVWPTLPAGPGGDPRPTVGAWRALEGEGRKVRSRALTNTLFARLFLCDLFVHGIGGGKYDELTDELMSRFYGIEPPGFVVLSATKLLPLPAPPVGPNDRRRLAREVRDLHYNPQRHLRDGGDEAAALARRRAELVAWQPGEARGRRERFHEIRAVSALLRPYLDGGIERARQELGRCEEGLRANEVRRRRDYAFVLFPEGALRPFCTRFLAPEGVVRGNR
jgi:hypothetical protein